MATSQQKLFKFTVDGGMHLQVVVHGGLPVRIDLQIANAPASLLLHWGVLCSSNNRNWTVPSSPPPGSRTYKQQALQTPMKKAHGKLSCLTIEIYDSNVYAIEFVFKDEGTNRWFKLNGHNIHIDLKDNNRVVSQHVITSNTDLKKEGNYVDMNQQGKEFAKVDVNIKKAQNFNHNSQMKWEASFILNKYSDKDKEAESSLKRSPLLLALESYGGSNGSYLQKDIFNLGRNLLAVLVRSNGKQSKIILVTDITEPIVLHWGLSLNRDHEWLVPPLGVRPKPSSVVDGACETQFKKGFAGNASLQFLEIELGENNFIGLPFVIRANRNWIKNNGSDFYTRLKASERNMPQNFSMKRIAKWLLDAIAEKEKDAERSLMHRFNIALDLTERAQCEGKLGLAGILVWMRFMATRRLTWNKNYNVKPREISVAQNRFTNVLQSIYQKQPHNRELVRLIMSTVGRGGQGDVGQRIRDEILAIQQRNNCKGGMMEEWHQKLHNNTNPDDVIICQALLDYIKSNFNIDAYWKTLNQNGMTREQLASYDRPIISEPRFTSNQKDGLVRDLTEYLKILKAVHSGADLDSAIAICVGYDTQGCNNIGRLQVEPIRGLSSNLRRLLKTVQHHVFNNDIGPLLEVILESRLELRSVLLDSHERLKDLIFLDLALDSTMRTTMERGYEQLKNAPPLDIILAICLMLVNLALSSDDNEDLVYCAKDWKYSYALCKINNQQWALFAKAVLDRTELTLADRTYQYQETLQPTADYLGAMLRIDQIAIKTFTEEVIRAGSGASLSILLNHFNPILRNIANVGRWQIINPVEARGFVSVVNELHTIQSRVYQRPTILVANKVKGEDEIPDGVVALLTTDMPDVLSHVSVRARTCKICFATCFEKKIFNNIKANEGKAVLLRPVSSEMNYFKLDGTDIIQGMNAYPAATRIPKISLKKRMFAGKYAVFADEFNNELVGSKSCNIANLRKRVPPWIKVPTSVAIPFGVFDVVLKMQTNKDVAERISKMNDLVRTEDFGKLKDIQKAVLDLRSPIELANELRAKMHRANILWQGEGHEKKWQQAWMAIKKNTWEKYGCSIMADGWTTSRGRTLINFLVASKKGTVFIKSVDASDHVKRSDYLLKLFEETVNFVGEKNVVQFITDNASNHVKAGEELMKRHPSIYWTPCAAHCLDLLLEDLSKIDHITEAINGAKQIGKFVYNNGIILSLVRKYTEGKDIVRPATTRFATHFLTLKSLESKRLQLMQAFASESWLHGEDFLQYRTSPDGRETSELVYNNAFWEKVSASVKVVEPLVHVLRIVDGDNCPMAKIYEAMDIAKEAIANFYDNDRGKYKPFWDVIDRRWNNQLHRPMHAAAHHLNPRFVYAKEGVEYEPDTEISLGFHDTLDKLVPDLDEQELICKQLGQFVKKEGVLFNKPLAQRQIHTVWASKWNERAYLSTRKLALDHNDLSMAVLIQEIISADYAFVIHTTNPLSKDPTEIYAEVVKGLGETLVGAYPGRAMGFVTSKYALQSPKIISYPSKKVGLFIKKSIIFRSDSNAEDLEGYAGAGLYDSVPMEPEEKCLLDYSSDKLIVDKNFQISILSKIAKAGKIIEEIYNAPQDIEGVIKDGEIYIVQTRPQM